MTHEKFRNLTGFKSAHAKWKLFRKNAERPLFDTRFDTPFDTHYWQFTCSRNVSTGKHFSKDSSLRFLSLFHRIASDHKMLGRIVAGTSTLAYELSFYFINPKTEAL